MKKYKIEINDNWNILFNYIISSTEVISWKEFVQLAIDYDCYAEFYLNDHCIDLLFNEYAKQWAYINVGTTCIWLIFTWIGLHLLYHNQ